MAMWRHSYRRKRPSRGIRSDETVPTVIFLTVCTKQRWRCLANPMAHQLLRSIWLTVEDWEVGPYVLMPDHIHLFASPGLLTRSFDRWVAYWKSLFTIRFNDEHFRWQRYAFHHRIRSFESCERKFEYVRLNPVRAGLVEQAKDWPYQGEVFRREYWW